MKARGPEPGLAVPRPGPQAGASLPGFSLHGGGGQPGAQGGHPGDSTAPLLPCPGPLCAPVLSEQWLGSAQKARPSALDPVEQSTLQSEKRARPRGAGSRGPSTTQSGSRLCSPRRCGAWKASLGWPAVTMSAVLPVCDRRWGGRRPDWQGPWHCPHPSSKALSASPNASPGGSLPPAFPPVPARWPSRNTGCGQFTERALPCAELVLLPRLVDTSA